MPSSVLLRISGLSVSFKSEEGIFKAVNNISFSVNKGEILGIVGESGSGKSVTALSILKLIPSPPGLINNGSITLFDNDNAIDILSLDEKEIRKIRGNKISMIFQEPMSSLNPVYKCGPQVIEALRQHQQISKSEAREKAVELFKTLQLPRPGKIYTSYPHELSGGQKQRVMIAMAMICNPMLLIADEPTTALDVTVQKSILELMKKLRDDFNTSILFITHDLGVIAEIANRVVVMYKGEIVEQGQVKDIFDNPQHPYTKGLLACRPGLDFKGVRLPTVADFMNRNKKTEISVREKPTLQIQKDQTILDVNHARVFFRIRKALFAKKEYVKAVDDVSFKVYKGETLGLVGESGCGKTTLGRAILQLIPESGGKIIFDNTDLSVLKKRELRKKRKDLQIIFQDPFSSLNPRLTVGEAIMEPMKVHRLYRNTAERREKTYQLLEKTGLESNHFNRYPHEFSGGQRQRICIARSLALNPDFIILDESVSALDVSIQAQILNLLNELKKEFRLTFIFISHDLSVVKFMSDRIAVMKDGKIVELGESDEIYRNPQTEYTRRLIDAIPGL